MTNLEFIKKFVSKAAQKTYLAEASPELLKLEYMAYSIDIMHASFDFEKHGGCEKWSKIVEATRLKYMLSLQNN
jgi:hypothetical protein